jgi:mRNA-degrading endonuclease RelE of RelBE toxin-antitoxin system
LNSVTAILAKRADDTPHLGGDQILTPTNTSEETDALDYVTEPLWPSGVALSVDESNNGKIDKFAPFLAEKPSQDDLPKGPEDFLKEITLEGDESFQMKLRELCPEYSDIFSDQLAEKPASLKPFEINIPLELWEKDENRTPVRPHSHQQKRLLSKKVSTRRLHQGL